MWFKNNEQSTPRDLTNDVFDLQKRVYLLENPYEYTVGQNVKFTDHSTFNPEGKITYKNAVVIKREAITVINGRNYGQQVFTKVYDVLVGEEIIKNVSSYNLKKR